MSDLETRIRRVEDRLDLRELVSRYTLAVDEHDMGALGPLFAPNGGFGRAGKPEAVVRGRDTVVEVMGRLLSEAGPSFHVVHDQVISFDETDPNRATGVVTCHAETSSTKQYVAAIRYRDRYLRHEGRWTFEERLLQFLYFVPVDQYGTILRQELRMRDKDEPVRADWPGFA